MVRFRTCAPRFLSIQAQDFIEDPSNGVLDVLRALGFLSIQAQDFIEERRLTIRKENIMAFLSIQAQDFIEEQSSVNSVAPSVAFLSIQAQDFIEDVKLKPIIGDISDS